MPLPNATGIQFAEPDPNLPGGPWAAAVTVTGDGFHLGGQALLATIGTQAIEGILIMPDGSGFAGWLETMPNDGDVLSLGYSYLQATSLAYHTGDIS